MIDIKKKFKAVIFDMDGTILDTEKAWHSVTIQVLKAHGFHELTEDQEKFIHTLSGQGMHNAIHLLKGHFNLQTPAEHIAAHKIELANTHFAEHVAFIEGFEHFHNKLREHGIPSSIATNATPENLNKLITQMKLDNFFGENIYCIAHVENKAKPDPALFLHAAEKLGVKPEECIVFEDSLPGFMAAQAAGMKCVAIKNKINIHLMDKVHGAIDSYHEAEEILKKL